MKQQELEKLELEITNLFKNKYPDVKTHVDYISGIVIISLFWDRINKEKWNGAKIFRCKIDDYKKTLDTEIKPFAFRKE